MGSGQPSKPAESSMTERVKRNMQRQAAQRAESSSVARDASLPDAANHVQVDRKGKAPVRDEGNRNGQSVSIQNEQSGLFVTLGPMTSVGSKRSTGDLLEESEQQQPLAKRGRKDAAKPKQSFTRNENIVASIEVQGEDQHGSADHPGRDVVELEPELLNAGRQHGSRSVPTGEPGHNPAENANGTVDLTADDDEDDGNRTLPRTGITAPHAKFGKAIQLRCYHKCKAAALTLSGRTDEEGKASYRECMGTLSLLMDCKTLSGVGKIMANDVKDVLLQANLTLVKFRDKYAKIYEGMSDDHQKPDIKRVLDRQKRWVETVEQTRNWRKDLVNDLREQSQAFLRHKL